MKHALLRPAAAIWVGIAPRQRGAWIETVEAIALVIDSPGHRPPATGGVD